MEHPIRNERNIEQQALYTQLDGWVLRTHNTNNCYDHLAE
jgi:hypothetical protein